MTISRNVWKIAALLLVLSLISFTMISGTFAKYTSTFAGEDTALVAKWDIVASGSGITMEDGETAQLDLFNHAYTENIITSRSSMYLIAPGIDGEFTIMLDNNSDVAADITFTTAATGTTQDIDNLPIVYWIEGGTTSVGAIDLDNILNDELGGEVAADTTQDPLTVYWSWPFDGISDDVDTEYGVSSAAINANGSTYKLTITATADQIAPED